MSTFSPIKLKVKIWLLRNCITSPITRLAEEKEENKQGLILKIYKETKDCFRKLFIMTNLEKKTEALINVLNVKKKENSSNKSIVDILNVSSSEFPHSELYLTEKPRSFVSELHDYQKQALTWMLIREGKLFYDKQEKNSRILHPLWEEYAVQGDFSLFFNPFSGQISVKIPKNGGRKCRGGILADEMGLGKTIMVLSLIHYGKFWRENMLKNEDQSLSEDEDVEFQDKKKKKEKKGNTLIVMPVTLISQWEEEINTHSMKNSISCFIYYGNQRKKGLEDYDIVLTTYGTLSSEFQIENSELFKYKWDRIVLDEAHYIKGRIVQVAKAAFGLKGVHKWAVSGTPLQNKVEEVFSLVCFLEYEPWCDFSWWNNYVNENAEMVQKVLQPILLRRTKNSVDQEGNRIIQLTQKKQQIQLVDFSKEEMEIYNCVREKSQEIFNGLIEKGIALTNYMKVFEILLRLRQLCDHVFMIQARSDVFSREKMEEKIWGFYQAFQRKSQENINAFEIVFDENFNENRIEVKNNKNNNNSNNNNNKNYVNNIIDDLQKENIQYCCVCLDSMEDAVITGCLHVFCRLCAIRSIENVGMCPTCRSYITKDDIMTVPRDNKFGFDVEKNFKRSSKMNAVFEYLNNVLNSKNDKCVIFSQFLAMFDLFEIDFKQNNMKYLRLDGSLNQKQRSDVIKKFNEDDSYRIFLISLKAGGVGLNLVRANHVFLIDPWWNPAVEEQAVDRIHRIGQKKDVNVIRFIMRNSIEERMIKLHEEKKHLFEITIASCQKDKKKEINLECFKYLINQ
ncbi:snf2 superfamily rad5 protein, putative [Ichthyophthirius multifiliis]|uniref:Snf2 superfamily rad5 protein, putative n=1 Tax=Ichthyophthirius multifiliis TaxID=5932 RepID=G0QQX6_ICHMU|nr:snf2 superfamily rad5 protein, putative [Ichthyophthirius multifiliis]EGR32380.1 snf2 superfamily rad5 protein, putative [Ichthyophthirius multifiliis]|eukprot:XP_004035866.1 snf2 superfamily rad5 protein, putative [Ichthyophthirius multifiliis]